MNHTDLDWSKAHQENAELMQQLREKEARMARLEAGLSRIFVHCHEMQANEIEALAGCLIREDEQQSLAHIQADAIEAARQYAINKHPNGAIHSMTEYAQQLRDKADTNRSDLPPHPS